MRYFLLLFSLSLPVFSAPCKVDGISDSPQHLSCSLRGLTVELTCRGGVYYLDEERVDVAYHMEVEEGPTPLVFHTNKSELTVLMKSDAPMVAELVRKRSKIRGRCHP